VQLSHVLAASLIGKHSLFYFLIAAAIYSGLTLRSIVRNRRNAATCTEPGNIEHRPRLVALLIFLMAIAYTLLVIRWSLHAGRLSMDSVADDVVYLTDGFNRLNTFRGHGLWTLLRSLWTWPPHSPWATMSAFIGFALFGIHDWSPYLVYGSLVAVTLFAANALLGISHWANRILILFSVLLIPFMLRAVHDFRPDFAAALFADVFALTMVRLACVERPIPNEFRTHFLAGLLAGIAYIAKPPFFGYTTVISIAAIVLAEVCYRIFSRDWLQLRATAQRLAGIILGTVVVPLPYYAKAWREIIQYFFQNAPGGSDGGIWTIPGGIWGSFNLYIRGPYMQQMLGFFGPLLILWIILGAAAAIICKNYRSLAFIICGLILTILAASIIVLGQSDNISYGLTWQLLLLLVAVFAIGEASRSKGLNIAAIGACILSIILCFAYPPTKDVWTVSQDCRGETSINLRALKKIAETAKSNYPILRPPSVFVTFAGNVAAYAQNWLAFKNRLTVSLSDLHRSSSVEAQLERAQAADFVEVADPNSKWMYHWLPSGPIQGPILSGLRANPSFEELDPIVGTEGILYLFQKKRPG
jgi:hypothetical protein